MADVGFLRFALDFHSLSLSRPTLRPGLVRSRARARKDRRAGRPEGPPPDPLPRTPLRRTPSPGPPSAGPPLPDRPKFRAFFPSPAPIFAVFFLSLGVFSCLFLSHWVSSRGILVGFFEGRDHSNVHVWSFGLSKAGGLRKAPFAQKRAHGEGPVPSKGRREAPGSFHKIPREDQTQREKKKDTRRPTPEREKKSENGSGRVKKARNFELPNPRGPPHVGPTPLGPPPFGSSPSSGFALPPLWAPTRLAWFLWMSFQITIITITIIIIIGGPEGRRAGGPEDTLTRPCLPTLNCSVTQQLCSNTFFCGFFAEAVGLQRCCFIGFFLRFVSSVQLLLLEALLHPAHRSGRDSSSRTTLTCTFSGCMDQDFCAARSEVLPVHLVCSQ